MAVSYRSTPFKSSPYVLPLNLGLMGEVLSAKQKRVDDTVTKIQGDIDRLGALDVVKPEDIQYLNQKIGNLVGSINNFGSMDWSSPNALNQVESLGSDIYTDNNVLNAIMSTKFIRGLVASYDRYKNDPKLSKLYSPVNELYDMQAVNKYMSDGKVGSSYTGNTQATPYVDYRTNHIKAFEKVKADITTGIMHDGYYIEKTTGKRITPDRIMSMAADLLTPNEREQMKRDGWFLYRNMSPQDIVNKAYSQLNDRRAGAQAILDGYKKDEVSSSDDPAAKLRYKALVQEQQKIVNGLNVSDSDFAKQTIGKLSSNPEEMYYQLYSNDYYRGLGNLFSVNQTDRDIKFDQAQMFKDRLDQQKNQFDQMLEWRYRDLGLKEDELNYRMLHDLGKVRAVDPRTGQVSYLDSPLTTQGVSYENPNDQKVTQGKLNNVMLETTKANNKLAQKFIDTFIAYHPELEVDTPSKEGTGVTRGFRGQQLLEDFNKQPGFQIDDLKMFETEVGPDGKPRFKYDTAVQQFGHIANLNSSDLNMFSNLYKNYQAIAEGKGDVVSDIPAGFNSIIESMSDNQELMTGIRTKINSVKRDIANRAGLTEDELAQLDLRTYAADRFVKDIKEYGIIGGLFQTAKEYGIIGGLFQNAKELAPSLLGIPNTNTIDAKLKAAGISNYRDEVDKYLQPLSNIEQFKQEIIDNKSPYYTDLKKNVMAEIINDRAESERGNLSLGKADKLAMGAENIEPISVGKAADGTGRWVVVSQVKMGSGTSLSYPTIKTYLSDDDAAKFGLFKDRFEGINFNVNTNGRSGDMFVYGDKSVSAVINVVRKNTSDPNDQSSFSQVKLYDKDENGQKISDGKGGYKYMTIAIPGTEGLTPSQSYVLAKTFIQQVAKAAQQARANGVPFNYQDFIDYISQAKNQNYYLGQ